MIKTRLLHLLGRAKKYVYLQVISQLLSTVIQILIVRNLALLITEAYTGTLTEESFAAILCQSALLFILRFSHR